MTDPDKLAAFKALAGDLGASMKDKVVEQGVQDEIARTEAAELQARLTVEREKMLSLLENDIDAMGWDGCPKIYAVSLADDGTEILNYIEDIHGVDPIQKIMSIAITSEIRSEAVAMVLSSEMWSYPDYLAESLGDDEEARHALYHLLPPALHPQHKDSRMVTLVDRTGQSCAISRERDGEARFVTGEDLDERVVSAMKCLLGIDRKFNKMKDRLGKTMDYFAGFVEIFHQGHEECWTEAQYIDALAEHLTKHKGKNGALDRGDPKVVATRLMTDMPKPLREHLGLE